MLLHSLRLDIASDSIEIGEAEACYRSNDLTGTLGSCAVTVCIEAMGSPHAMHIVTGDGQFVENNLCGAPCYYGDEMFTASLPGEYGFAMRFDPQRRTLEIDVAPRFAAEPIALLGRILRPLLQSFLLPFFGLKSIHAAALSGNRQTVLLTGSGGSGKSTLAIALARAGYDLLSDDGPFLAFVGAKAHVLSSLDPVHVTARTLDFFPGLKEHVLAGPDHRQKFFVAPVALTETEEWRRPHRVSHVVRLRRNRGQGCFVREVDKQTVLREILAETMVVFRHLPHARFREHSELVLGLVASSLESARTFELEFADSHPSELVTLVQSLPA